MSWVIWNVIMEYGSHLQIFLPLELTLYLVGVLEFFCWNLVIVRLYIPSSREPFRAYWRVDREKVNSEATALGSAKTMEFILHVKL